MTHLEEFKLNIFNEILNGKKPFDLILRIKDLKGFEKDIRRLALKFARYAEQFAYDERVKNCNDVVERYLNGGATIHNMASVRSDVWSAAWSNSLRDTPLTAARSTAAARAAWYTSTTDADSAYGYSAWYSAQNAEEAARSSFGDDNARDDLGEIFVEWLRGLE